MNKRIITFLFAIVGILGSGFWIYKRFDKEYEKLAEEYYKKSTNYKFLYQWIRNRNKGKEIELFFKQRGIKNIAIYGVGDIGILLKEELSESSINVDYGIDRSFKTIQTDIKIYGPDEDLPRVDAIIVTSVHYYDEIKIQLENRNVNCTILSMYDLFYEV